MAAYLLIDCKVIDASRYEDYKRLAQSAIARYGGKYLVRGGQSSVLEGTCQPNRVVVLEFPSLEQARAFYDSPEYAAARVARKGAAQMNMIAVAGV